MHPIPASRSYSEYICERNTLYNRHQYGSTLFLPLSLSGTHSLQRQASLDIPPFAPAKPIARRLVSFNSTAIGSDMCLFNVDGGQRAVIFDRFQGVKKMVVGEGTHFMIPVIQKPIIIDVRARPRTINSITGTKDLQMANISLRVLSRPLESELPRIYQELGTDFDDRVLPSLGNEVSAHTDLCTPSTDYAAADRTGSRDPAVCRPYL